jgi:hypothetical protein
MTRSILSILILSLCFSVLPAVAQTTLPDSSGIRLSVSGGASIPLGSSAQYFGTGYLADLSGSFWLTKNLFLDGAIGYSGLPLNAGPSVQVGRAELGLGYSYPFFGAFAVEGGLRGGGYYGMLVGSSTSGTASGVGISASALLRFSPTKNLDLKLGARYRYLFGLWNGVEGLLSGTLRLEPAARKAPAGPQRLVPLKSGSLGLEGVEFGNVFPVFFKYYNEKPLGTALFANTGKSSITDLAVSFYAKQYMDAPKLCSKIPSVAPGEKVPVDIVALFADRILEITEGTMVSAEIAYSYMEDGQEIQSSSSEAMRVLDRNAMSWFDDRCVAAYVTAKDPAILGFAKNVVSSIKADMNPSVNKNLQLALAVHDALDAHGLNYAVDPKSSYTALASDKAKVDFLQFPRQTLEYKAGDCDDISILYSALLESVGIETAFVTVPGHIYMAFSLDVSPDEARKAFSRPDELIMRGERAWIPVEITDREGGFLAAWQTGAKEWRENLSRDQAGFYPLHEAWATFEPVQLPGASVSVAPPSGESFRSKFRTERDKFVDREIFPMVAKLQAEIQKSQASPKSLNALGVLYARYGLYDKAEGEFAKIVGSFEYVPSLLNLGNIHYLRKKLDKAQECYERAYKIEPKNPYVVLNFARINHDAENYGLVKKLYEELKSLDAALAFQFAYLDLKGEEAARAADITQVKELMVWLEE